MAPEGCGDELEEGDDMERAEGGAGRFAIEEEVEEAEAYWVALNI